MTEISSSATVSPGLASFPAFLYGLLIAGLGLGVYLTGVLLGVFRLLLQVDGQWLWVVDRIVWYSGIPVVAGLILILCDLFVLLPYKRGSRVVRWAPSKELSLTVVLTAFNDELSIGHAVEDFAAHPLVRRVVVVDNNSTDRTSEVARKAGAFVVHEPVPGYGSCVYRALREGLRYTDTDLTLLCEGDMTFRAYDIEKFLAYLPHADLVNGTRISEQLREQRTQLSTFMYYGNFFAGKLLEVKHLGKGTFTDVGTTYKLCRNRPLERLLPYLNPAINLEFNAHLLDTALARGMAVVECPITFHNRVGFSKGGNSSNWKALKVGTRMILGIVFGWRKRP
ncbi:glycosyltransferase family 2 protein [Geomonas oryzisoli]|uniref:Glycosyltransferase family 2 protein n=1 Tax=Geomonas oryzisoli TaxID=2847992 RepID=A0ABX8JC06_9BACT|nr:glycosyltransferase family 2 protein [Geomonas oryzisoli]QWV95114.1 glycosyltransferase family 2 protein [Geomonas oryzisoli]